MDVLLLDGTYELYRAHFGAPSSTTRDGREVGASRGLMRSLMKLLRERRPTHVAIAFDHVIESFRNALFDGYKTSDGVPPELFSQFSLAEDVTRALGICTWPMTDFEADDAIATAAARCAADARVGQVRIGTLDKDLAQCVRDARVVLWDRFKDVLLDEAAVRAKFGVGPSSIADLLALTGDTADGVPGISRWGAKSAAAVLAHYERLDAIPADAAAWKVTVRGAASLAQSLAEDRPAALLYRELTTLRLDVPIDASLEALAWRGPRPERIAELANALDVPAGELAEGFAKLASKSA